MSLVVEGYNHTFSVDREAESVSITIDDRRDGKTVTLPQIPYLDGRSLGQLLIMLDDRYQRESLESSESEVE